MKQIDVDVLVVGGGSAGVAAALAASRNGSKVLLADRNQAFGGQATNSWVPAYCGFYSKGSKPEQVVYGIGEEVLQRLKEKGQDINPTISKSTGNASIRFRPEVVKSVLDELMAESSVDYHLFSVLSDVEVNDNEIVSATLYENGELIKVKAKAYIDCSGEANLARMAGCEVRWGNKEGEVQQSSLSCLVSGIPKEEILMSTLTDAIVKGKEAGIPYLDKEKGMIVKVPSDDFGYLTIPSVSIDGVSSKTVSISMITLRKKANSYVETLRRFAPGFENIKLLATAPNIGIRESYRIVGKATVSDDNVINCDKNPNTIGRGGWPAEVHAKSGLNYRQIKENDYFDIDMNCLWSKDFNNLFMAGRHISCDCLALASIRVMGTGFVTGQGAGVMASLYTLNKEVNVNQVQDILKKQNVLL